MAKKSGAQWLDDLCAEPYVDLRINIRVST
jgi:hypothetical protein